MARHRDPERLSPAFTSAINHQLPHYQPSSIDHLRQPSHYLQQLTLTTTLLLFAFGLSAVREKTISELESSVNPQAGKPALRGLLPLAFAAGGWLAFCRTITTA